MSNGLSELLCRACLQEDEFMVDINEEVEELQMNLCTLLQLCGNITVKMNDAYPKFLCKGCTTELLISAKFRKKCDDTQQRLSELDCQDLASRVNTSDLLDDQLGQKCTEESSASNVDYVIELEPSNFETVVLEKDCESAPSQSQFQPKVSLYFCDNCGAVFHKAATLERHIEKAHAPVFLYNCQQCGHTYTQEANIHTHICSKVFETESTQRRHRCSYCDKRFPSASSLNMHVRLHNGERPYACDVCPKTFKTNAALVAHQKRHLQLSQYQCPHCNKSFVESSNLRRHIVALHTDERPHSCTVCQRSFSRVYLLELHMRTHTGERPYACTHCDRRFAQLSVMRSHERSHTNEHLHRCGLCFKSFRRAFHLRQHSLKYHVSVDSNELHTTTQQQHHGQAQFELGVVSEEIVTTNDD